MNEWQPIKTAPKNKFILVSVRDIVLRVIWYDNGDWYDTDKITALHKQFTHWMPLPEPAVKTHYCANNLMTVEEVEGSLVLNIKGYAYSHFIKFCPICGESK